MWISYEGDDAFLSSALGERRRGGAVEPSQGYALQMEERIVVIPA